MDSNTSQWGDSDNHDEKINVIENTINEAYMELQSLNFNLDGSQNTVHTKWILKDPSMTAFLHGEDMKDFKNVSKLLDMVNEHDQCIGDMNSCLISYYRDGQTKTRQHSDNQEYLCSESSICNLSLGENRKILFFNALKHSSPPLKSFDLADKSLLIMQPGTQTKLKHLVAPNNSTNGRYCLSFRRVKPLNNITCPEIENDLTVILGTSITSRIDQERIVGKYSKAKVINSSTSGAKISDISEKVDQLYAGTLPEVQNLSNRLNLQPKNFIISMGTNDIRNKKNGVHDLYYPIKSLLTKIKALFPNSTVYVQCCLPIRPESPWIVQNVTDFNFLLRRCCREFRDCFFMDLFEKFLDRRGCYPLNVYYNDNVHLSYKGLGILARAFIKVVRGSLCDMKFI